MPQVSALIPHYGDPAHALALVGQLEASAANGEVEIIVIDDNSPVPYPDSASHTVVHRPRNGGFGAAVNSGAAVATGELLLILNSDLSVGPDFVKDLLRGAARFQPAIVSPRVTEDGETVFTSRRWPRPLHHVVEWLTPLARWRHHRWWQRLVGHDLAAHDSATSAHTDWLRGACLLIPREIFERLGGFDERFYMNSEEVDLAKRASLLKVARIELPTPIVAHAGGGSSDPLRRRGWVVDSRFRYHQIWGGARRLRVGLRVATGLNFCWNLTRAARGVDVNPRATRREELALIRHGWRARHDLRRAGTT